MPLFEEDETFFGAAAAIEAPFDQLSGGGGEGLQWTEVIDKISPSFSSGPSNSPPSSFAQAVLDKIGQRAVHHADSTGRENELNGNGMIMTTISFTEEQIGSEAVVDSLSCTQSLKDTHPLIMDEEYLHTSPGRSNFPPVDGPSNINPDFMEEDEDDLAMPKPVFDFVDEEPDQEVPSDMDEDDFYEPTSVPVNVDLKQSTKSVVPSLGRGTYTDTYSDLSSVDLSLSAMKPSTSRIEMEEDVMFGASTDSNLRLPALPLTNRPLPTVEMYISAPPIHATTFNGQRFQLSRRKRIDPLGAIAQIQVGGGGAGGSGSKNAGLAELERSMRLEAPYPVMLRDIQAQNKLNQKTALADSTNTILLQQNLIDSPGSLSSKKKRNASALSSSTATTIDSTLWTDRYRPKRFTDLLGDERVHRSALLWLKEWDQCVFTNGNTGKGRKVLNAASELKRERRKKRARDLVASGGFNHWKNESSSAAGESLEEVNVDPFGRPSEKILLMSGPPGLGKTTLAHVLARQAGYQVLEINASDDRTGKVVEDRIRNALESNALGGDGGFNKGTRPTCVIVDEVDGAGGGGESSFVRTLIKLVSDGSSTRKYKGEGKKDRPLLRPIICICNDLYSPILRPLRAIAKIIRFAPPTNVMIVKRLRTICDDEGMKTETKHLTLLAEFADGDLRNCLNTLQFIKRRTTHVDEETIRNTVVGMKDTGTSATTVVERLFKKPPRKKGNNEDERNWLPRVIRDVQTSGEYEKISQGCFENYLSAKSMNDDWPRIVEVNDWLSLYDRLDGRLRSDRDYELLAYVPYTFAPWYKLFSSYTAKPLEYPKADYEAYQKRTAHQEIVDTFKSAMPHTLRTQFTGTNLAAELLPFMNRIICPDLKPINSQLIKTEERAIMQKLINLMISLNISFVHDRNEEGQLTYKLDPPIEVFVHFDGKRASDIAPSRYAVRHLLTTEIEAERNRRVQGDSVSTDASLILSAYKTKVEPVAKAEVRDAVDFFGRVIAQKPLTAEQMAAPPPPKLLAKAVYRYHEGFSNAVRVTKRISDFLL